MTGASQNAPSQNILNLARWLHEKYREVTDVKTTEFDKITQSSKQEYLRLAERLQDRMQKERVVAMEEGRVRLATEIAHIVKTHGQLRCDLVPLVYGSNAYTVRLHGENNKGSFMQVAVEIPFIGKPKS